MVDVELGAAVSPIDGACKKKVAMMCVLHHFCEMNQVPFFLLEGEEWEKSERWSLSSPPTQAILQNVFPKIEDREAFVAQICPTWEKLHF